MRALIVFLVLSAVALVFGSRPVPKCLDKSGMAILLFAVWFVVWVLSFIVLMVAFMGWLV